MTCPNCGATLESTDAACPVCATPVAADADPADTQPMTDPSASDATRDEEPRGDVTRDEEPRADATVGAGRPAPGDLGDPRATGATGEAGGPRTPAHGPGGGHPAAAIPGVPAVPGAPGSPGAGGWQRLAAHPSGLSSETRGWGIAAHLLGLGGALVTAVTLGFAGPLVVWLLKRDDHPFIDHHAKESLNFQLTTLVALVAGVLAAIPVLLLGLLTLGVLWLVAIVVIVAATVVWFVFPIVGAVKAANGEGYRYPVSIRFVR